ncbi:ArgP/LysG family DNA-binding transcriptional regulator [Demequina litorisediminis]|uniref:Transcriptional regulator ArgP n=1 Tax=Demequina litorisediminis TaxID=1849022 RepID=A0ABQ6IEI1_9MICO|nr:ArgP/LysG family DNA-binding transcriptional regulator [Demequina litorisediminis]GMA36279.1 transcriptional regulator ArgP [Demequina litorisediminis]
MKVPVDLAHTLAVAVEEGTLDAAARRLHLTQSAVSQRLATLERLTGQVLLVRSRPVRATAAGEQVVRYARQVAHLDADLAGRIGVEAGHPTVALAVNADSLATWILPALATVATRHGVLLDLHREDEGHTTALLADGTVTAAVTTVAAPVPGCTVTALGRLRYRAVAAPEFAARWFPDGATAEALRAAPVLDFDRRDTLQSRYLDGRGIEPSAPPRHYVPSSTEFARAIALGLGWAMLPDAQRQGLDLVDLGGEPVAVTLYWQQWRTHSATLADIAAEVAAAARTALEPAT